MAWCGGMRERQPHMERDEPRLRPGADEDEDECESGNCGTGLSRPDGIEIVAPRRARKKAEGEKQAAVTRSEGNKQSAILDAEGASQARQINAAAERIRIRISDAPADPR